MEPISFKRPQREWFATWAAWQVLDKWGILHTMRGIEWRYQPGCFCCGGPYVLSEILLTIDLNDDLVRPVTKSGDVIPISWDIVEGATA